MGKQFNHISEPQQEFITRQHIFFVATAASEGKINLSPKGTDSFRIIDQNKIVWLNLTGSGNETAAHLILNSRMTIMFCAFEGSPEILRLYGNAKIFHERDREFLEYIELFPPNEGARQIIEMHIEIVQSSCGFAVPFMDFKEDRKTLNQWSEKKGKEKIKEYWKNRNTKSIDGFETRILE
jgi:hypothetical protein